MDPIAHAGLAYLVWTTYTHVRARRPPTDTEFWLVLVGSLLPDLVDKPLAWTFGVLPAGRSLGHSLVTAAVLVGVVHHVLPRSRSGLAVPFGVALVGHDLLDTVAPLRDGDVAYIRYLLWPLVEQPPYDTSRELLALTWATLASVSATRLVLVALIALVWIIDGAPGLVRRPTTSG